jgi:hypothetical protein
MALVEAFHGTTAIVGVGAPWPAMGSLLEREERGRGWERGDAAGGGMGRRRGRGREMGSAASCSLLLLPVREEEEHVGNKGKIRE